MCGSSDRLNKVVDVSIIGVDALLLEVPDLPGWTRLRNALGLVSVIGLVSSFIMQTLFCSQYCTDPVLQPPCPSIEFLEIISMFGFAVFILLYCFVKLQKRIPK